MRADLSAGHPRRQDRTVRLAATGAHPAVQSVLLHIGLHRRNVKDLVRHRLAPHVHLICTFALRLGQAVVHTVEFLLVEQRSVAAGVTLLRSTLALAGTTLRAVRASRTIRGRRLRGIARVQLELLLHRGHLLTQLLDLQRQRIDDRVALLQRRWLVRKRLRYLLINRGSLAAHRRSVSGKAHAGMNHCEAHASPMAGGLNTHISAWAEDNGLISLSQYPLP